MLNFDLPWPPSTNHYWRHQGKAVMLSKPGRLYRMNVAIIVGNSGIVARNGTLVGRLAVSIIAHPPDFRQTDLDNRLKAVLDSLTHAKVWDDDSQIDDLRIRRGNMIRGGKLRLDVTPIASPLRASVVV